MNLVLSTVRAYLGPELPLFGNGKNVTHFYVEYHRMRRTVETRPDAKAS